MIPRADIDAMVAGRKALARNGFEAEAEELDRCVEAALTANADEAATVDPEEQLRKSLDGLEAALASSVDHEALRKAALVTLEAGTVWQAAPRPVYGGQR